MKRLTLVRHAKSSWADSELTDFDRPLNDRGNRDAPKMAKRLRKRSMEPDVLLSSSALRARTTATILADGMDIPSDRVIMVPQLYLANVPELLTVLKSQSPTHQHAMLVAHNPGLTELGNYLGESLSIDNIPTCGVLCLDFAIDKWEELSPQQGQLVFFDFPKNPVPP